MTHKSIKAILVPRTFKQNNLYIVCPRYKFPKTQQRCKRERERELPLGLVGVDAKVVVEKEEHEEDKDEKVGESRRLPYQNVFLTSPVVKNRKKPSHLVTLAKEWASCYITQ
jgi:hypothetical protein